MTEDLGILMEHLHYLISGQSVTEGYNFIFPKIGMMLRKNERNRKS
jgi:hypothetical protein